MWNRQLKFQKAFLYPLKKAKQTGQKWETTQQKKYLQNNPRFVASHTK